MLHVPTKERVPALHEQWNAVDFAKILRLPTAYLCIGQSNSIMSSSGAQGHEGLWERGRAPGGNLGNTIRLIGACRETSTRIVWFRYEIFREHYVGTELDRRSTATGRRESRGAANRRRAMRT